MLQTDYGSPELTRFARSSAQQVAQKYEKELSGVVSTALSVLNVFRDPLLERLMADSDFRIEDLRTLERPVSLYLVVPPSDARHLLPLLRLLWEQLIRRQLERLENDGVRHKLLLMLDEFPRLGRLDVLGEAADLTAGYGLQMYMLCQGATHVAEAWGPNHRFITNSAVRLYTTPNDNNTAREISEQLGPTTNVHQMRTFTGHRLSPWLGHVMISDQESQRPLLTVGEVLTMDRGDLLICPHAAHPIRARKLRYFEDPEFKRRVLPAPALQDAQGRRLLRLKARPSPWLQGGTVAAGGAPPPGATPGVAVQARDIPGRSRASAQVRAVPTEQAPEREVPIVRGDAEEDIQSRFDVIAQETLRAEIEEEAQLRKVEDREREPQPGKLKAAEEGAFHSHHHRVSRGAELER
jgi:type IV secretion system protein VirD4